VSVREDFEQAVNMTPKELEDWLQTEESKQSGTGVGHDMGERIVEIKRTKQADLTEDDEADMQKVVGYVKRHLAQGGPDDDVEHSTWRYSLKNWGHDPLK
jgi:hypothetical protein